MDLTARRGELGGLDFVKAPDLSTLIERAAADPQEEAAFFRAVPAATVYAHAPRSDDHASLRLIQFLRPDGEMVLPVFTSREKAEVAAGNAARVLELTGSDLMRATPGATWMIDPNDAGCTLRPEDLASLLLFGELDRLGFGKSSCEPKTAVAIDHDEGAEAFLRVLFRNLTTVDAAYLLRSVTAEGAQRGHVVVVAVSAEHAEAAAKAVFAALIIAPGVLLEPVGILDVDPREALPEYLARLRARPFYRRKSSK